MRTELGLAGAVLPQPLSRAAFPGLAINANLSDRTGMSFTGKVKDGVVVLPPGLKLPDGLEVQLIVPDSASSPSFAERYAAYIGAADDLPSDLAENLDLYVHGHRKP